MYIMCYNLVKAVKWKKEPTVHTRVKAEISHASHISDVKIFLDLSFAMKTHLLETGSASILRQKRDLI